MNTKILRGKKKYAVGSVTVMNKKRLGGNIYANGGMSQQDLYDFLFDDDEEETQVTAPSEEEVKNVQQYKAPDTSEQDEYESTLQMAMNIGMFQDDDDNVSSSQDPFYNNRQIQSIPHGAIDQDKKQVLFQAAQAYGVPEEILTGVYGAESGFGSNTNVSSAGAKGAFQFMDATARQYGVNVNDFQSSANGASHYLSDLYKQFGNWQQAVAAYNAGPGNVSKGIYPKETRNYVPKVMGYANSMK